MANTLYDRGRQAFLDGEVSWSTDNIKLVLSDESGGAIDPTVASVLADISSGTVATSGNFASKAVTDGIADAADVTCSAVSGASIESVNIYFDTGVAATSLLLVHLDSATGLPVTPNGGDITVSWDNGSNKIFKL